jgi:hypothetical protein
LQKLWIEQYREAAVGLGGAFRQRNRYGELYAEGGRRLPWRRLRLPLSLRAKT